MGSLRRHPSTKLSTRSPRVARRILLINLYGTRFPKDFRSAVPQAIACGTEGSTILEGLSQVPPPPAYLAFSSHPNLDCSHQSVAQGVQGNLVRRGEGGRYPRSLRAKRPLKKGDLDVAPAALANVWQHYFIARPTIAANLDWDRLEMSLQNSVRVTISMVPPGRKNPGLKKSTLAFTRSIPTRIDAASRRLHPTVLLSCYRRMIFVMISACMIGISRQLSF